MTSASGPSERRQEGAIRLKGSSQSGTGLSRHRLSSIAPFWGLVAILILLRWGTFDVGPTWDAAMSIWPAAIEVHRGHSLGDVLAMPSYAEGGPNTHTLSLVTLLTIALISVLGANTAIVLLHALNLALLVGVGYMTSRIAESIGTSIPGWLVGGAAMLFPVMVGQSAYLYTELPSAFFVLLAMMLALQGRMVGSVSALAVAVLIKPLAVVAVAALVVLLWRDRRSVAAASAPLIALPAILPALILQRSSSGFDGPGLSFTVRVATEWGLAAPELVLLAVTPIWAYIVLNRSETSRVQWSWFWGVSALSGAFVLFFALNGLFTAGHFFLPRYASMLIAPTVLVLATAMPRSRHRIGLTIFGLLIALSLATARGPLALGMTSIHPPIAERSLAYLDLASEHRRGFADLATLGSAGMPIFGDHYAGFAFKYPEMRLFSGRVENFETVRPGAWGEDLKDLPGRFAMLHYLPFLGGERLLRVRFTAASDPGYELSVTRLGTRAGIPVEIVIVRRVEASD